MLLLLAYQITTPNRSKRSDVDWDKLEKYSSSRKNEGIAFSRNESAQRKNMQVKNKVQKMTVHLWEQNYFQIGIVVINKEILKIDFTQIYNKQCDLQRWNNNNNYYSFRFNYLFIWLQDLNKHRIFDEII